VSRWPEIETDKATFTVEAEQDGYVLSVHGKEGDILKSDLF